MDSNAFERLKYGSEHEIASLYQAYLSSFVKYIGKEFRCPPSKAEEIYPEAFSILYFNIKDEKLTTPLKSTLQTYLNSTGWNLYHRRNLDKYQRDKIESDPSELLPQVKNMVEEAFMQQERAHHVRELLDSIGEPCKTLLYQVYFNETSYKELALNMDIPEPTLRKRKFDCLGKLRRLIDERKLEL